MGKKALCKSPESILVSAKFALFTTLPECDATQANPSSQMDRRFCWNSPLLLLPDDDDHDDCSNDDDACDDYLSTSFRTLPRCPMSKWELSSIFTINLEVCYCALSDKNGFKVKG